MKKKVLKAEAMPEFEESLAAMPEDSKIFVDKSLEIADFIFWIMEQKDMKQKDLAEKMGKSEAEISKLLAGMHNYTLRSISKIEAALGTTIICTPKTARFSFPAGITIKGHYEVAGKKQEIQSPGLQYNTKVVQMSFKYSNLPEPVAI